MLNTLGIQYIDHFAVTTRHLTETLDDFLSLPGARLLRGPGENPAQKVSYAFVQQKDGAVIEILSPMEGSPIEAHLKRGGGAYHICYAVLDLDSAISHACKHDAKIVVEPRADYAFDGRRVAFLIHPNHGLFELLEALPVTGKLHQSNIAKSISTPHVYDSNAPVIKNNTVECKSLLLDVFKRQFENIEQSMLVELEMDKCSVWDSLKHMLLFMDIESTLKISIPTEKMAELKSFTYILEFVTE